MSEGSEPFERSKAPGGLSHGSDVERLGEGSLASECVCSRRRQKYTAARVVHKAISQEAVSAKDAIGLEAMQGEVGVREGSDDDASGDDCLGRLLSGDTYICQRVNCESLFDKDSYHEDSFIFVHVWGRR